MYKIAKNLLPKLFAHLSGEMDLYLPVRHGEAFEGVAPVVNFAPWQPDSNVDLAILKTAMSPKQFFLPSSEGLYSTAAKNQKFEITPQPLEDRPFAIFGVRACDAAGMDILDKVFLGEPVDRFYEARRNAATIITLACEKPGMTCFCTVFDIDPTAPAVDVAAYLTDTSLYWQPLTEKGENLTAKLQDILVSAPDGILCQAQNDEIQNPHEAIQNLPLSRLFPKKQMEIFNSPKWDELHHTCLACGTCTFICPTCQCYDIGGFDAGQEIKCHRCWDSCMFPEFTQMAHGNPRPTHKERFRQRFMHKLVYTQETHGKFGCVGCGRCVNKCPVNLNIVKVIREVGENV